jgi:hypothetical protein
MAVVVKCKVVVKVLHQMQEAFIINNIRLLYKTVKFQNLHNLTAFLNNFKIVVFLLGQYIG